MMNRSLFIAFALPLTSLLPVTAQVSTVRVGINDQKSEASVLVSPVSGRFSVLNLAGDTLYNFRSDDVVSIKAVGDSMELKGVYGLDERVVTASVVGSGPQPSFLVKRGSDGKESQYPGKLMVSVAAGKLTLVNTIDMDTYVARVVQSEVGSNAHDEYYKIQGIICRTYAVGNKGRHGGQGFDVCDHQHCQVYGTADPTEAIAKATAATSGIVMADTSGRTILAAFHANCGGQTAHSQDVWAEARSYLISVPDTFCLLQRSAKWTEQVPLDAILQQFGPDADTILTDGFGLEMAQRQSHITIGKESVRTADLRRDLRLRSAFFGLKVAGSVALLSGRGFGHGVGLCQQGAMNMAKHGHNYSEILGHYYTNVALVNISSLK